MKNLHFPLFAALLIGLIGCNRSDDGPNIRNVLLSKTWYEKEHYFDSDGDGVLEPDSYSCTQDNEWHFLNNQIFQYRDGAEICEPDSPISFDFDSHWELTDNDNQLVIYLFGIDGLFFNIEEFDENHISLRTIDIDDPNGPPYERIVLRK